MSWIDIKDLGLLQKMPVTADLNQNFATGLYITVNATLNVPPGNIEHFAVFSIDWNGDQKSDVMQIAVGFNTHRMFMRHWQGANGWSDWVRVALISDIPTMDQIKKALQE